MKTLPLLVAVGMSRAFCAQAQHVSVRSRPGPTSCKPSPGAPADRAADAFRQQDESRKAPSDSIDAA